MATVRYIPGKGYRIEWHITVKKGPHQGEVRRGSQLISCKKPLPAYKKLAERVKAQRELEAAEVASGLVTPLIRWADFLAEYHREKEHQKTIATAIIRLTDLGEFCKFKIVEDFTGRAITLYIDHLRQNGKTPATIRKILNDLSAAMTSANNKKYLTDHPFKRKEIELPPKANPRDRWLTRDEFARFLRMCRSMPETGGMSGQDRKFAMDFAWQAIFIVNTGLRINEFVTAKRSDLQEDRITVYGKGKRGQPKKRTVSLNRWARQAVRHIGSGKDGFAFPFCNRRSWYQKYLRWFGRAGIEGIGPHVLRRTFGSWLAMAGTPLHAIQQNLGHQNVQTTINHYAHLSPDFLRESTSNMRYHVKR